MTDQRALLDEIRREIDAIDTQLHDLIMRRFSLSEQIAAVKSGGVSNGSLPLAQAARPGREAEIIRRLLARHEGNTPPDVIVRLWREIVTASLMLQTAVSVEIFGSEDPHEIWDLARGYFGSSVPMQERSTAKEVLRDLSNGECAFGVLPMPQQDEREPWWPQLSTLRAGTPRIVARLPFVGPNEGPSAFLVAAVEPDDVGEMVSVFTLASNQALSRNRINGWLEQASFEGHCIASIEYGSSGNDYLHLVTFGGLRDAKDAIFADLGSLSDGAFREPTFIGAYPKPIILDRPDG
jgi:chorismate mutase/prephenate dehydratase